MLAPTADAFPSKTRSATKRTKTSWMMPPAMSESAMRCVTVARNWVTTCSGPPTAWVKTPMKSIDAIEMSHGPEPMTPATRYARSTDAYVSLRSWPRRAKPMPAMRQACSREARSSASR